MNCFQILCQQPEMFITICPFTASSKERFLLVASTHLFSVLCHVITSCLRSVHRRIESWLKASQPFCNLAVHLYKVFEKWSSQPIRFLTWNLTCQILRGCYEPCASEDHWLGKEGWQCMEKEHRGFGAALGSCGLCFWALFMRAGISLTQSNFFLTQVEFLLTLWETLPVFLWRKQD